MDGSAWISVVRDPRGESALAYLPRRPSSASEVMIFAQETEQVDAWTAVALRSAIEYHGRFRQKRVVLTPPKRTATGTLLATLLDNGLPRHFCLANDSPLPSTPATAVVLPSSVLRTLDEVDALGDSVVDLGAGKHRKPLRFLAGALVTLSEGLISKAGPLGLIACICHEREEDELQLVVSSLRSIRGGLADGDELRALLVDEGQLPDLEWLDAQGARLGLDVTVTVAASAGRFYLRRGRETEAAAAAVEGVTMAVTVHL